MKLAWTPETAAKSYIDTVRSCKALKDDTGGSAAEMISAMAGGYGSQMMIETWSGGEEMSTSIGLAMAAAHTAGRHVCLVPDEAAKEEYCNAMQKLQLQVASDQVVVAPTAGEAVAETMAGLEGVDFLVVDCAGRQIQTRGIDYDHNDDYSYCRKVVRHARFGGKGAVVICKNIKYYVNRSRPRIISDQSWRTARSRCCSNNNINNTNIHGSACVARWLQQLQEGTHHTHDHHRSTCSCSRISKYSSRGVYCSSSKLLPMGRSPGLVMEIAHVAAPPPAAACGNINNNINMNGSSSITTSTTPTAAGADADDQNAGDDINYTTSTTTSNSTTTAGNFGGRRRRCWITVVDHTSGEEHVFRG
ncbi:hypothetical protein Dimus_006824 [Dionaea muscipula]